MGLSISEVNRDFGSFLLKVCELLTHSFQHFSWNHLDFVIFYMLYYNIYRGDILSINEGFSVYFSGLCFISGLKLSYLFGNQILNRNKLTKLKNIGGLYEKI